MKLTNPLALISLIASVAFADITVQDQQSKVKIGFRYYIDGHSDHDFQIQKLDLVRLENGQDSDRTKEITPVDYNFNITGGDYQTQWRVPEVKDGMYRLIMTAVDRDDTTHNLDQTAVHRVTTNNFKIGGGDNGLEPKEIAGVVVGCVVGVALFVGAWYVIARCLRKRKNLAVDLEN